MAISSDEASRIQFSGTEHSYDGSEVEAFRRQVVAALEVYEAASVASAEQSAAAEDDLASAQRVRHQSVALAERMLRDVMSSSPDDGGGLQVWQEAAMLRAQAEEEMAFAEEEARRLPAMAAAERDQIRLRNAEERRQMRTELSDELQASRDAALAEAEDIKARSSAEADTVVKRAVERAEESQRAATDEINRLNRRVNVLHTALADAESRFRRLAATAANEMGTLAAIADQDIAEPSEDRPEPRLAAVDLTGEAPELFVAPERTEEPVAVADADADTATGEEAGFYQKRLAGLRDRLEKSGNPPS